MKISEAQIERIAKPIAEEVKPRNVITSADPWKEKVRFPEISLQHADIRSEELQIWRQIEAVGRTHLCNLLRQRIQAEHHDHRMARRQMNGPRSIVSTTNIPGMATHGGQMRTTVTSAESACQPAFQPNRRRSRASRGERSRCPCPPLLVLAPCRRAWAHPNRHRRRPVSAVRTSLRYRPR